MITSETNQIDSSSKENSFRESKASTHDESLLAEKNQIDEELCFSVIISLLFCIGIAINIACLFSLRRHRSTFHRFLKMLACFDGLVVTWIFLMYALPVMCSTYKKVRLLNIYILISFLPCLQSSTKAIGYELIYR